MPKNLVIVESPSKTKPINNNTSKKEAPLWVWNPTKNIEINAIIVGNLPLHGTKLFVKIATNLSRGESIILHPVIPTALHPNPMHIVKACFPQAQHFWKQRSKLKAIRGKYPKSSNIVNKGKKIAIGGNITDTTQANVPYAPSTNIVVKKVGKCKNPQNWRRGSVKEKNKS